MSLRGVQDLPLPDASYSPVVSSYIPFVQPRIDARGSTRASTAHWGCVFGRRGAVWRASASMPNANSGMVLSVRLACRRAGARELLPGCGLARLPCDAPYWPKPDRLLQALALISPLLSSSRRGKGNFSRERLRAQSRDPYRSEHSGTAPALAKLPAMPHSQHTASQDTIEPNRQYHAFSAPAEDRMTSWPRFSLAGASNERDSVTTDFACVA